MKNTTLCGKILHFVVNCSFLWYNITFLWYNITFCSTFVVYLWYICDIFVVFFAMGAFATNSLSTSKRVRARLCLMVLKF